MPLGIALALLRLGCKENDSGDTPHYPCYFDSAGEVDEGLAAPGRWYKLKTSGSRVSNDVGWAMLDALWFGRKSPGSWQVLPRSSLSSFSAPSSSRSLDGQRRVLLRDPTVANCRVTPTARLSGRMTGETSGRRRPTSRGGRYSGRCTNSERRSSVPAALLM